MIGWGLTRWVRLRLRAALWRQWKTPRRRRAANQWVLDLAADNPMIVAFVGHLDPGSPSSSQHLARFAKNRLFRGIRLTGRAIATGLSQKPFVVGIGKNSVYEYLDGKRNPGYDNRKAMADALGLTEDQLPQ